MPIPVCDCRNMDCPRPVVLTKKLLESESPARLEVLVSNDAARENVTRLLAGQGYTVSHGREADGAWRLLAARGEACDCAEAAGELAASGKPSGSAKTLVLISAPVFGAGDDALGARLMRNFLLTLPEMGDSLWRIILLNGGVQLAAQGSPVLDELKKLAESGVDILVCGACLEHFGLMNKKAVGETTNMLDVVTSMQVADKFIRV